MVIWIILLLHSHIELWAKFHIVTASGIPDSRIAGWGAVVWRTMLCSIKHFIYKGHGGITKAELFPFSERKREVCL